MVDIKFGTDGWRAIIADTYTLDNLSRVAQATALFMQERGMKKVLIGHDCRFGGRLFLERAAVILAEAGLEVFYHDGICTTPMISLGVVKHEMDMGVVITASHNPPSYNGYKLKSAYGGPTVPADISAVEALIPDVGPGPESSFEGHRAQGRIHTVDLKATYIEAIEAHFDLDAIRRVAPKVAYDAMYGAGFVIINELFPRMKRLHCEHNPGFDGQAPEPIHRNLSKLSRTIANDHHLMIGFANDGDADRIGMYDEYGSFVDSHHILLLLLMYLYEHKGLRGKVVTTFSVTDKMQRLAESYGLESEVTKIGFKYIAEIMINEDVLVGGEESGGLAVKGNVPERDGIWIALMILEFMSVSNKSLSQLCEDLYAQVGRFAFDRYDLKVSDKVKKEIIRQCQEEPFESIGSLKVLRHESLDGYKFFLENDTWLMIRPSGTEPVLRVYCQAPNLEEAHRTLDAMQAYIESQG